MVKFISDHIDITKDICGGTARIAGTRIRVQDVVLLTEMGKSPDEIVISFPHISLADVHAALAYYHDNRDEIERQIKEDSEFVEEMKKKHPSILLSKI